MMIEIQMSETDGVRCYTLSSGKATLSVTIARHYVSVCSHNAAASLRRNMGGKVFHGADALAAAAAAYKSAASKAMIEAVQQSERALAGASATTIAA